MSHFLSKNITDKGHFSFKSYNKEVGLNSANWFIHRSSFKLLVLPRSYSLVFQKKIFKNNFSIVHFSIWHQTSPCWCKCQPAMAGTVFSIQHLLFKFLYDLFLQLILCELLLKIKSNLFNTTIYLVLWFPKIFCESCQSPLSMSRQSRNRVSICMLIHFACKFDKFCHSKYAFIFI